jgi:5'-3' exonuclease
MTKEGLIRLQTENIKWAYALGMEHALKLVEKYERKEVIIKKLKYFIGVNKECEKQKEIAGKMLANKQDQIF